MKLALKINTMRLKISLFLSLLFTGLHAQDQQPPMLFQMYYQGYERMPNFHFVSLSEAYPWHLEAMPPVIAEDFLEYAEFKEQNYHVFSVSNRKLFLDRCGFSEKDFLFVYDLDSNITLKYPLAKLKVSAFLSLYSGENDQPFREYDYVIGLEIDSNFLPLSYNVHQNNFAIIAQDNPFEKANTEILQFTELPYGHVPFADSLSPKDSTSLFFFTYKYGPLQIIAMDRGEKFRPHYRRLLVYDLRRGVYINSREYYDSEGSSVAPLNIEGRNFGANQWVGPLIKGYGPILFGFSYQSFGCVNLEFLVPGQMPLPILCDNRH